MINAFITPHNDLRAMAREMIGPADLMEIYIKCPFDECERRDVKGLYAKAKDGGVAHFTGAGSAFEEPDAADLVIETSSQTVDESLDALYAFSRPRLFPL